MDQNLECSPPDPRRTENIKQNQLAKVSELGKHSQFLMARCDLWTLLRNTLRKWRVGKIENFLFFTQTRHLRSVLRNVVRKCTPAINGGSITGKDQFQMNIVVVIRTPDLGMSVFQMIQDFKGLDFRSPLSKFYVMFKTNI